jgi:hypothetical protein
MLGTNESRKTRFYRVLLRESAYFFAVPLLELQVYLFCFSLSFSGSFLTLSILCHKPFYCQTVSAFPAYNANPGPSRATFFRLWTMQYRFHWMFTVFLPCRVK